MPIRKFLTCKECNGEEFNVSLAPGFYELFCVKCKKARYMIENPKFDEKKHNAKFPKEIREREIR